MINISLLIIWEIFCSLLVIDLGFIKIFKEKYGGRPSVTESDISELEVVLEREVNINNT